MTVPVPADTRVSSITSGRFGHVAGIYEEHGVGGVLTLARYYAVRAATLAIGRGRYCPSCGWRGREFRPMVLYPDRAVRANAVCPGCGSWERHRAAVPMLGRLLDEHFGGRPVDVLHFSPEECFARVLRPRARSYRKSNYENPAPDELQLDVHAIALPDGDIDLAAMSYVLACVRDDRAAAASLWRVLRPGGLVVAAEPFTADGRHLEWGGRGYGGQWRTFGTDDVAERFRPFEATAIDLLAGLAPEERRLRGLSSREFLLVLRKPADA